jgi:hypothetical protein
LINDINDFEAEYAFLVLVLEIIVVRAIDPFFGDIEKDLVSSVAQTGEEAIIKESKLVG